MLLQNMVYQGTVLGPPAWNIFFADVAKAVTACGFEEAVFADDPTAQKQFPAVVSNDIIKQDFLACQRSVHN